MEQGVCLQHHLQAELLAGGGLVEIATKLHGGARQYQGEILQVRQPQGLARGEVRGQGPQQRHGIGVAQLDVEGAALMLGEQLVKAKADVGLVQIQLLEQGAVGHHRQAQADLGEGVVEALEQRHDVDARLGHHADAQDPRERAAKQAQLLAHGVLLQQHALCVAQHHFPRLGQGHELAVAHHQLGAEGFFQGGDAGGQGRLGDEAGLGRLGEVAVLGQLVEIVQLLDVHRRGSAWRGEWLTKLINRHRHGNRGCLSVNRFVSLVLGERLI
ncbi:hypothetical protein D3C76_230780 [compost metagenome]